MMAVGDAHGQLLWVCGRPAVLGRAEQINFAEGATWDEAHAGTNAPGTALRIDAPVQILAAEHFLRSVQPWTCAAAPIHDPVTQALLGIVDVTGGTDVATPQTLAMVRAAARMAEAELGRLHAIGTDMSVGAGQLWTPPTGPTVAALGRPDCLVELDGRHMRLSPRHSEILVLLTEHRDGLTGDQLAVELYREDVGTSTLRAELTRLRSLLGTDVLDSRPYRLRRELTCDWLTVRRALDADRADAAIAGVPRAAAPALGRAGCGGAARSPRPSVAGRAAQLRTGRPDGDLDPVAVGRRRPRDVATPARNSPPRARRCTSSRTPRCTGSTASWASPDRAAARSQRCCSYRSVMPRCAVAGDHRRKVHRWRFTRPLDRPTARSRSTAGTTTSSAGNGSRRARATTSRTSPRSPARRSPRSRGAPARTSNSRSTPRMVRSGPGVPPAPRRAPTS